MMTVEEFESGWLFLVSSYGLQENRYMQDVFHCRDKWAKPYLSSNFCAKMSSTQGNECMNNVLKTYVSLSAPLNRFVMQYNKLIASRCEEEDFEMAHTKKDGKVLHSNVPNERHASNVYTRVVFKLFSVELYEVGSYVVKGPNVDGRVVVQHVDSDHRAHWCKVSYVVMVDRESDTYNCECAMYEHMGLLCRHALRVMIHVGVLRLPTHYVMKRWTRDARDILPDHIKNYQTDSYIGVSKTFRHNILYVRALQVVKADQNDGSGSEDNYVRESCLDGSGDDGQDRFDEDPVHVETSEAQTTRLMASASPTPLTARFASATATASRQSKVPSSSGKTPARRRCSICNEHGHNKVSCPLSDEPKKPPKKVRCGKCGMGTHYESTCGGNTTYKRPRRLP
ncbi:hypothetical protein VPH35_055268 [Triticum aestivum]